MANAEVDSALRACKLIHSNSKDAAEKLRLYLDEAIKQKYGSSKTITNVLTKEMLDDLEHGSYSAPASPLHDSRGSLIGNDAISPIIATSPLAPILITDDKDIAVIEGDINLKDLLEEDLMCVVCRGINVTARNRLVECVECHSLYHQECHKPHISEADVNDPRLVWYCATCKTDRSPPAPGASSKASHKEVSQEQSSKTSSSSTMSSSKGYSSGSSSKSSSGSKNTSSTSKSQTPPSSSSTSSIAKTISPIINIISVDKRLQNMKRKAAKQHESKRKHSK